MAKTTEAEITEPEAAKPAVMYEITTATHPYKQLNKVQKTSSHYSEEPRIGTTVLRRGRVLKLTEEQFKAVELRVKTLFKAGAIKVKKLGETVKAEEVKSGPTAEELAAEQAKVAEAAELAKLAEEMAAAEKVQKESEAGTVGADTAPETEGANKE